MSKIDKSIWDRRALRNRIRGHSGFGKTIALAEWKAAAGLWSKHIAPVSDWVVDLGAGNGGFWNIVERPQKLLWLDISSNFTDTSKAIRITADTRKHPFADGSIECIVALGLTEYLDDLESIFSNWRKLVSYQGKILFTSSPPILMNQLRKLVMSDVHVRTDKEICTALENTGWKLLHKTPVHAGWQSLFAAESVDFHDSELET